MALPIKFLSLALFLNALLDFVIVLDPLRIMSHNWETTAFASMESSANKTLLIRTFGQSFLVHGFVRALTAYHIDSALARTYGVLSYMSEFAQVSVFVDEGIDTSSGNTEGFDEVEMLLMT